MNQQNNIDDLFKNSAQQFSAPAPKKAWANIDGVLKRKRKVILFQKVLLAATVVIIASVAFFVNIDNTAKPQLVDGDIDATIETPIINSNNDTKITDVVNKESIIENKNVENIFSREKNNSDYIKSTGTEVVNVNVPQKIAPISIINDVEDNIIILDKDPKSKIQEIISVKEVVPSVLIAKNSELNIKKEELLNTSIPEETIIEINPLNTKDVKIEIAKVDNTPINRESGTKETKKEKNLEIAAASNSEVKKSNTIKQETTEVVKTEKLTQATVVVESKVIESITPEVEETKVVIPTKSIEFETPSAEEAQIAIANARAAASNVQKRWDVDFLIGQTYGISVTNGIGKTPVIDNPVLSEAGATKASTWFSAAVNFELDVNNWVVKSGIRRYNLEIYGDFEVKQKNPWNVDLDKYAFSELGYIKIININSNLRLSKPSSIIYIQDFNRYVIKVRYIDVPLSVGYKFRSNNLSLVPHIGINYTMAYSNEVKLTSEDGYYMFGEVIDLKKHMIGVTAGCGAYYEISKHWMVGLDAEMVYYPSTVSTNSAFSYNPYSLLVGPSVAFKF